ncbi:MAG: N-acetylmannosamine-6-phosphate 2-epimerase [Cyanobacteria bacterium P01_D01_bin.128]
MIATQFADLMHSLKGGLVVSCQAPPDSPLYASDMIAAIAEASVFRGAVGVRIDTPEHIKAVRSKVNVPIIGLWKQSFPHCEVYITPQFCHAEAIAAAGADIIAIDGTERDRPAGETVPAIIQRIHTELGKPVMADIDTLAAAKYAADAGADLIGTTLFGYTADTQSATPPGFALLEAMRSQLNKPLVCEGGIASPAMARKAINLGADTVVVGTAITGVDLQVIAYCKALKN